MNGADTVAPLVAPSVAPPAPATRGTSARKAASQATVSVGMAIALGAVAMCFAALLLGYAILRAQAPSWPPPGEAPVPRSWSWLLGATAAALAGSAAMRAAVRVVDRETTTAALRLKFLLIVAAVAGTTFIGVQILGWASLSASGIRPNAGIVASVVYALTLFHAVHALAALVALIPALVRALRGGRVRTTALAAIASFWHLVTIVWLVVLVAVFIV